MVIIRRPKPVAIRNEPESSKWPNRPSKRLPAALALFLALLNSPSVDAALDFAMDIDLGVIRSDNILLAPEGEELSETIYTVAPQLVLTSDDERFQADIRYRPEAYFYSELEDADDVFHVVDASLTTVLVKDRLFIDLNATNFQSIVTPEAQIPSSNIPVSENRIDSRAFEVRPYWRSQIGRADLQVEAGYSSVNFDGNSFQSSNERSGRLALDNFGRQQGLAWGIDYQYRRVEYDISAPWEFQRASLNLGFWVGGSTRFFGVGGAETSIDNLFESNMDSDFWEAGFQYSPNRRLNIEIAAGERSFGNSIRGDISYEMRRGGISISYSEEPGNQSELSFGYRPLTDTDNLDNVLDRPGESDRFLRRRGEFNSSISLARSELSFRLFVEQREQRTEAEGAPLEDEELSGAAVRWSWQFGSRTSFGIGADVAKRNQSGFEDELRGAQIDIAYQLTDRLSLRIESARFEQEGRRSSVSDYNENQYRLLLRTSF